MTSSAKTFAVGVLGVGDALAERLPARLGPDARMGDPPLAGHRELPGDHDAVAVRGQRERAAALDPVAGRRPAVAVVHRPVGGRRVAGGGEVTARVQPAADEGERPDRRERWIAEALEGAERPEAAALQRGEGRGLDGVRRGEGPADEQGAASAIEREGVDGARVVAPPDADPEALPPAVRGVERGESGARRGSRALEVAADVERPAEQQQRMTRAGHVLEPQAALRALPRPGRERQDREAVGRDGVLRPTPAVSNVPAT